MDLFTELYRIFFGNILHVGHLAEIIFRTLFMYFYTVFNVRLMDKRSMGMLTPFEIIIIIALGAAVPDPMFYREIPLIQGMLVISMIVLIERVITKLSMKSRTFERLIDGVPVLIISNGRVHKERMLAQNISHDELDSMLRLRGVMNITDIDKAYLEPSGSLSIIRKDGKGEPLHTGVKEHL